MNTLSLNKTKPTPVALLTSVYMKIVTSSDPKSLKGIEALQKAEKRLSDIILSITSESKEDDDLKSKLNDIDKLSLSVGSPIEALANGYRTIFSGEIDENKHTDEEVTLFYSDSLDAIREALLDIPCETSKDEAEKLKLVPYILWEGDSTLTVLEKDCKKLIEEVASRKEAR